MMYILSLFFNSCALSLPPASTVEKAEMWPASPQEPSLYYPVEYGNTRGLVPAAGRVSEGRVFVDDVPFVLNGNAFDLSLSMAGLREPFRVKRAYHNPKLLEDSGRCVARIPYDTYSAVHILAWAKKGENTTNTMSVRIGPGGLTGLYEDFPLKVPSREGGNAPFVVSRWNMVFDDQESGYVYHLRVPLRKMGNLVGLERVFSLELTRSISKHVTLPDPSEFALVPAGRPSSVFVLASTLERAPLEIAFSHEEPGNIFYENQKVVLRTELHNRGRHAVQGDLKAKVLGPGTAGGHLDPPEAWSRKRSYRIDPGAEQELVLDLTPEMVRRGWYDVLIEVWEDGNIVLTRQTTFAILAQDTRKAGKESPFGVWCFFDSHNIVKPADLEMRLGSIMKKGGWRYTYGGAIYKRDRRKTKEENSSLAAQTYGAFKEKHGVSFSLQSPPHAYQRIPGWFNEEGFAREVVPWLGKAQRRGYDPYYKVLHESRSSVDLLRRFSEFLGGDAYEMPAGESAQLETQFTNVLDYTRAVKRADPEAKVVLVNDYPAVGIEYMRRGFPKDAFDVFGSEGANFMREPERQPDWLSLLGTLQQWRRAQRRYGYEDKPLWMTEALYHGTNPGNLSLHKQAVIYVREAMLALANGVQRLAATGTLKDSSDDYRWSNWGSSGFCFRAPEFNPKPSYAMYAWLTQVLDRAKYADHIKTDSTSLHLLDFVNTDGGHIYPMWVVRGRQEVTLEVQGGTPIVYGPYGNVLEVIGEDSQITVPVSDAPVYVSGTTVKGVLSRTPSENPVVPATILVEFDDPDDFTEVEGASKILEGNWDYPRVKGNFDDFFAPVDDASALTVKLNEDDDPRKLLYRYAEYALEEPVELPVRPYALTARVKGNGGWGRIMFELKDAAGQVWTSCGNQHEEAMNSSDNKGDSYVSFDGWQTMNIPLPGQYPGDDQFVAWPRNYDWWPTNSQEEDEKLRKLGIARVHYPLKLTKVIVAMQPHILYVDDEVEVPNQEIAIDRIGVIKAPEGM